MKIHHLNCGTLHAPLVNIASIVYCLLVETSQGLVLIDTGFGTQDYLHPNRKMRFFLNYMGVPRLDAETAISQVQSLGFNPADVKHIIQTHLHVDHAGGLVDFPAAEVHVFQVEYQAVQKPRGVMEFAYVQQHWAHHPAWKVHVSCGQEWFGFEAIQILDTPEADFYFLPLPGHTRGHCGVAIGKPGNWLLHCGDAASAYHGGGDIHQRGPSAYTLSWFPDGVVNRILGGHVPRIRALLAEHGPEISAVSSHDIFSYWEYNGQRERLSSALSGNG